MSVPDTQSSEGLLVERLPVYTRSEADLYHWAGRLLIAKGQYITPDIVMSLQDAGVTKVYAQAANSVGPDQLEEFDVCQLEHDAPLPFTVYDAAGNCVAREGTRFSRAQLDEIRSSPPEKVYYFKPSIGDETSDFESKYASRVRDRLDAEINFGKANLKSRGAGIPISRTVRRFAGYSRPRVILSAFESAYAKIVSNLDSMWNTLANDGYVWNSPLSQLVDEIVTRFMGEPEIMAALASADVAGPMYPEHCVATSVYCLLAAARLDYNRKQARDLVAAALFHDVGYVSIPKPLLEAERSLSKGERRIIFRHIEHNLFLSSRIDWESDDFAIAVYQHHERGTGAGYPTGYRADKIHEYASILAVADVFHALISERPHRKPYLCSQAMNTVLKMASIGLLDRRIVRVFVGELSLYPIGSCVSLSNGEVARVLAASADPSLPWVGTVLEPGGSRLKTPRIRNLSTLPPLSIRSEVPPFEEPLAGF